MLKLSLSWAVNNSTLMSTATILHHTRPEHVNIETQYKELTKFGFTWLTSVRSQYHIKDFGDVFEKYMNN
ncbi:hypothetical protein CM50_03885 [Bacillus subtilis]|nr:hypothetical protein CM50_03885 [Bacillus subtilis] [Bacillus stercoris]